MCSFACSTHICHRNRTSRHHRQLRSARRCLSPPHLNTTSTPSRQDTSVSSNSSPFTAWQSSVSSTMFAIVQQRDTMRSGRSARPPHPRLRSRYIYVSLTHQMQMSPSRGTRWKSTVRCIRDDMSTSARALSSASKGRVSPMSCTRSPPGGRLLNHSWTPRSHPWFRDYPHPIRIDTGNGAGACNKAF